MRHATLDMTMNIYTHAQTEQVRAAIDSLPDFESKPQIATGTDGRPAGTAYKPAYKKLAKNAYSGCDQSSSIGTADKAMTGTESPKGNNHNPLIIDMLDTKEDSLSAIGTDKNCTTPERTRTPNPRFRRPMLYPIELQTLGCLGL